MSASILYAAGLPELVADDLAGYRELALRLAHDGDERRAIRAKLAANIRTEPMFDTPRFVRNLERGYVQMWDNFVSGTGPRMIDIRE